MSARTLFWICWINSLVCGAQSQNTHLSCPTFVENTLVTLSLEVANSSFSSCIIGPTIVVCYFTRLTGMASVICGQSVKQCNTVPTPDECVCTGATGTGYTYSLNFTARQADHGGGDFSCDFDCVIIPPNSSTPPSVDIAPSCLSITVASPQTSDQAVTVAGKPGASSNGLSTAAAVGVMAAVMTVGVAATVIWMWRRQWILPCASNADSGESRGTPDEHHRPTPAGVLETGGQEDISLYDEIQHSSVQGDPPVPGDYEHLKMQDVGMRSVYSGLRPYPNRARC